MSGVVTGGNASHSAGTKWRVAVIGGGVSGLAAANRLRELHPSAELLLFEAGTRLGGVVQTESEAGFLLELSADSFLAASGAILDLCRRLGLEDELVGTKPEYRRAFVVRRGRLYPVPDGFALLSPRRLWPLVTSPLLSVRGKLRVLCEVFVPPAHGEKDESLAEFARRRLGVEAYERLVQPLVGGIYTGDAEELSLAATFPRFLEMERRYGSLIRGARRESAALPPASRQASGARYGMFATLKSGLGALVQALACRLPQGAARLGTPVKSLQITSQQRWRLRTGEDGRQEEVDAVILATSARDAGLLLAEAAPELAALLQRIPYATSAVALAGYRREQIGDSLCGMGFVVPRVERRNILSCSYTSQKFPGRAPPGKVLLRVFLGGAQRPELVEQPDEGLRRIVIKELADLLRASGEPELFRVVRWRNTMPQYQLGHVQLVAQIEALAQRLPNLALAGNAYHGVGLPQCVESGELAAARLCQEQPAAPAATAGTASPPATA